MMRIALDTVWRRLVDIVNWIVLDAVIDISLPIMVYYGMRMDKDVDYVHKVVGYKVKSTSEGIILKEL